MEWLLWSLFSAAMLGSTMWIFTHSFLAHSGTHLEILGVKGFMHISSTDLFRVMLIALLAIKRGLNSGIYKNMKWCHQFYINSPFHCSIPFF